MVTHVVLFRSGEGPRGGAGAEGGCDGMGGGVTEGTCNSP